MPVRFSPTMRANHLITLGSHIAPVTRGRLNNCNNTLCYTYNHNYINAPHNAVGKVGTTAASALASRKRI